MIAYLGYQNWNQLCMRETGRSIENTFFHAELGLQEEGSVIIKAITGLLEKSQNLVLLEGYQCDKCGNTRTSRKADLVTHISEVMIFHLGLFQFSNDFNAISKITPNLCIQEVFIMKVDIVTVCITPSA